MNKLQYNAMRDDTVQNNITVFGGYDHTLRPAAGSWYDMRNLTSKHYPVLSVRDPRECYTDALSAPRAIMGKSDLVWCDADKVYYGKEAKLIHTLRTQDDPILVSLGANIVIFPDGVMYNTVTEEKSDLSYTVTTHLPPGAVPSPFRITICDADGNDLAKQYVMTTHPPGDWTENYTKYYVYVDGDFYLNDGNSPSGYIRGTWEYGGFYYPTITVSNDPPWAADDGVTWLDTSGDAPVIKKYSLTMGTWVKVSATYFKLSSFSETVGQLNEFRAGDTVTITLSHDQEMENALPNGDYTVISAGAATLPDGSTERYIICSGVCCAPDEAYGTVVREVPPMDFVIEGDNRLWGCRYGIGRDGEFVNEIYACKLGDPTNWFAYQGVSTDAYAVSVGSDGAFTGAIFYAGCPVFFKERYIHRVGGSMPANYTMYTTKTDGVQAGSGASLCCVRNTLYYKSPTDIMAYTGSYPMPVSAALGGVRYYDAAAGEVGGKYYISMREGFPDARTRIGGGSERESDGKWCLFVYDTDRGLWHIEDETHAIGFARLSERLYCMDEHSIFCVDGGTHTDERDIEWYAQTGICGLTAPTAQSVGALCIHAVLEEQSSIAVFIEYDSDGKWEACGNITGDRRAVAKLPITPRRCDHYALRIEGKGACRIYSITCDNAEGSEIRWK